ncbi:diguanylate cyclase (GGDEF)-like protein [Sphaerotilus hippei]|uniref:diguanylate cyclase n=1 Tax=Sphaerotilus hippei TaxID=744406 RepID=A0A318GYP0_9BURK|nr:GGDEF domain-containing protein [Sphaerotilus hippei]PXW93852.1 diguanylate cyclase (GGDEF)-like protein [Sphaerotilus hippei]
MSQHEALPRHSLPAERLSLSEPTAVQPLEHVADMTRSRDREMVDATLLSAFIDLLPVVSVVLWRVLGEPGNEQRWLRSGAQRRGDLVAELDVSMPRQDLLLLQAMPDHAECYTQVRVVHRTLSDGCHVLLPMASEREVEGVVELVLPSELDVVRVRMAQAVLKIHRNFLSLLDYSERDTLTGLLNRKSFDETFLKATVLEATRLYGPGSEMSDDEDSESRRHASIRRHWLGVIDIDFFKRVNDSYGHLIGDEVLVLVARIMRNTFRYDDRLYRFGGEEFVVLLAAPDETAAHAAFERLRSTLEAFAFPRVGRVTASIGFSDVRPGDTPQAAFERADRAVYHGKENGRNQVCSHSVLVAAGQLTDEGSCGDVELF